MNPWSWFGGSAAKKKDVPKEAILGLRQHLEMLEKRGRYLETQMEEQDNIARKNISTNKNAARAALKRKKMYETQLDKLRGQMETLETEVYTIEAANLNSETIKTLKNAADAMKVIHKGTTVEQVDKIMDDLENTHAIGEEIDEAMTRLNQNNAVDVEELEDELNALEQEALDDKLSKISNPPVDGELSRLPKVGTDAHRAKTKNEEEEEEDAEEMLKKLQMEMAL